jgi:hypothetical protein
MHTWLLEHCTIGIPTPEEMLSYTGHEPDWGPRVMLRSRVREWGRDSRLLAGTAAYGDALREQANRDQITRTLLQFPTVREVRIAIEGQTNGIIQP